MWELQLHKALGNTQNPYFYLINYPEKDKIAYTYSRIPLTDLEAQKTLYWHTEDKNTKTPVLWKFVGNNEITAYTFYRNVNIELFDKLRKRFYEVCAEHKNELDSVPNNKVICYDTGTSKLIRDVTKTRIHIGRRKRNKSGIDYTTKNSVCIPDNVREEFFADSKLHHGMQPKGKPYVLTISDGKDFEMWSSRIDAMFYEQVSTHRNKKIKHS